MAIPDIRTKVLPASSLAAFGMEGHDYVVPSFTEGGRMTKPGSTVGDDPTQVAGVAARIARHAAYNGGIRSKSAGVKPSGNKPQPGSSTTKPNKPAKQPRGKKAAIKQATLEPSDNYYEPIVQAVQEEVIPVTQAPKKNLPVVFNTHFGKMRMMVDDILEDNVGFVLVFANEDEVRFTPEQGSVLPVVLPSGEVQSLYTGCLFNWNPTGQQLMFFVRNE